MVSCVEHIVLRLHPYHPDLNPVEKVWGIVKHRAASKIAAFETDDTK
jgi:transposase